jgi:ATP-dependent Lon protease
MGGNIEVMLEEKRPSGKYEHLFAVLPSELQDTAFLDRIHGYLPGWEIPVIVPDNYANGYGFMTDYLAEIFAELRRRNFITHIVSNVAFDGINQRNQDSIKKTGAGMLKLLYPHLTPDSIPRSAMEEILSLAIEMRKRVVDQLAVIKPSEFSNISYDCRVK